MQCAEFDALLSEALDGKLTGAELQSFQAHADSCVQCGPLMAEAEQGRGWLKSLAAAEPPVMLVTNILVATSGVQSSRLHGAVVPGELSWMDRLAAWGGSLFSPVVGLVRQPRFAMSFGMAFFSLSLSMSLAGVKLNDVKHVDLRPSAVKRTYYETSGRVVKYYENIRFVYEIESRVREFKRVTQPEEAPPKENKPSRNNSKSGEPERQERNYSQWESQPVLASLQGDLPVVTVNTNRRLS
jgi:hypothetical protein